MSWLTYNEASGYVGSCSVCLEPSDVKFCSTKCYMADEYPGFKEYKYTCLDKECRRNFTVWALNSEDGKECFDCGEKMGAKEV